MDHSCCTPQKVLVVSSFSPSMPKDSIMLTNSFTRKSISIHRPLFISQTICMISVRIPSFDGTPQAGQLKINEVLFHAVGGTIKYNVLLTKVERTPSSACCRRERNASQSFFRRTKTADKPVANKDCRRLLSSLVLILKVTIGISIVTT